MELQVMFSFLSWSLETRPFLAAGCPGKCSLSPGSCASMETVTGIRGGARFLETRCPL